MIEHALGVTIGIGERFSRMAQRAAARFTSATGLPALALGETAARLCGASERPHRTKFGLFDLLGDAAELIFFDADLVFLRPFDVAELRHECGFSAARDLGAEWWIKEDAASVGVPASDYFNSGLFWISRRRFEVLALARRLAESGEISSKFNDQGFLNAAAARTGGVHFLDKRYNYHVDKVATESLKGIVGAHFHGISSEPDFERYYDEPESLFWREV